MGRGALTSVAAAALLAAALPACRAQAPRFLKGQTHAHSSNSGDSETPAGSALHWYTAHGYDFVVFTDHNYVTVQPADGRTLAIPGVEITQNAPDCEPPPEAGLSCLLHVNALFLPRATGGQFRLGPRGRTRLDRFRRAALDTHAAGGLAQINHPNFDYAADAALLAALARDRSLGPLLLEIANQAWDSNNAGDARHPSTEALWDAVLSTGADVWGVATDDAHHYDDAVAVAARGEPVFTGDRGFVMVHARPDAAAIREAMAAGDFYASTGVILSRAERDAAGALVVEVAAESPGPHRIACIGKGGRVISETAARAARCPPPAPGDYVRAVVTDGPGRHAWLQPARAKLQ